MEQQTRTGIEVKVGLFPLAFFLFFFPPVIQLDEREHRKYWGTHFFELEPGKHAVRIFIKYFFFFTVGDSSTKVVVEEGKPVRLSYYMPPSARVRPSIKQS